MKLPFFDNEKVYDYWIFHLKFFCAEEGVQILAAIMMTNHYHVLLYTENFTRIQRVFQRLNTGFSQFMWNKIIKGSRFEQVFSKTNHYRLFSSTERMFPVEGHIALFIDTRYLFDNPKHHNSTLTGFKYPNSTFNELYKSELEKKDLHVFYDLYGGLYPNQVARLIIKPYQEFREAIKDIVIHMPQNKENELFKVDPKVPWKDVQDIVWESYQAYDF